MLGAILAKTKIDALDMPAPDRSVVEITALRLER